MNFIPMTRRHYMIKYHVRERSGISFDVKENDIIRIIDAEGRQVADFFAISAIDPLEHLSTGVTIDCNSSIRIGINDFLYSNLYNRMFQVIEDTVKRHDLLYPCCRTEMFDFLYDNGKDHPNCFDNINNEIKKRNLKGFSEIKPFNIFMNTEILNNGKIIIKEPVSKKDDYIILKALTRLHIFIAACSTNESSCNGGKCTGINVVVD